MNEEDFVCSICRCPMSVKNYEPCASDEVIDDCIRFKCGHAFHTGCACLNLRVTDKCPMCRSSDTVEVEINGQTLNLTEDLQEEIDNLINGPLMEDSLRASELLERAGKSPKVQLARKRVNKAIREFRLLDQTLKYERSQEIRRALNKFKQEKHAGFIHSFNNVKLCLKRLKTEESIETERLEPTVDIAAFVSYNVKDVLNSTTLSKKFWNH